MLAIIVLAALFLLALPFAVLMRMQHASGTQALHAARAHAAADGALSHAMAVVAQGLENRPNAFPFNSARVDTLWEFHVTLRTRAATDIGDGSQDRTFAVENAIGFPNDNNPDTVDGFIRVDDEWMAYSHIPTYDPSDPLYNPHSPGAVLCVRRQHRRLFGTKAVPHGAAGNPLVSFYPESELWDVEVQDQQALININSAPYNVILNLLQELGIGDGNPARQKSLARAIATYRLYYAGRWASGAAPEYTPFENLSQLRNVALHAGADAPRPPLSAEELARLRRCVTVRSERTATWVPCPLQASISNSTSGAETCPVAANLITADYVGLGTIMRFTRQDGGAAEYRIVIGRNSDTVIADGGTGIGVVAGATELPIASAQGFHLEPGALGYIRIDDPEHPEWIRYAGINTTVSPPELTGVWTSPWSWPTPGLAFDHKGGVPLDGCVVTLGDPRRPDDLDQWKLEREYDAAVDGMAAEVRHAININTLTSRTVLRSLLRGIKDGPYKVDSEEAHEIADGLLRYTSGEATGAPSWFDGNEDWFDEPNVNPRAELNAFLRTKPNYFIVKAGLDTNPSNWPEVSTVPLRFESGTMIGIDPEAIVDDRAGMSVAQVPEGTGRRVHRDYDVVLPVEPIFWRSRSQYDFETFKATGLPSTNVHTTPLNMGLQVEDFNEAAVEAYKDDSHQIGSIAPTIYTTMLEGLHGKIDFNLDYSIARDIAPVTQITPSPANTTSEGITSVRLQYNTDYVRRPGSRHLEADSTDATMQPFAVEFWIRPGFDVLNRQYLMDLGASTIPDMVAATSQVRVYLEQEHLVIRIDEPVYDPTMGYAGYVEAISSEHFPFRPGMWHYVAIAMVGTARDEIALFIDGIYDRYMSWTYHHGMGAREGAAHEDTVKEGSFLPVAMAYPNRTTTVTTGPAPDGSWAAGDSRIGLTDDSWLPAQGAVVIGSSDHAYAYDGFGTTPVQVPPGSGNWIDVTTIRLVDFTTRAFVGLKESHSPGEKVAMMLPVARTAVHTDTPPDIVAGQDRLALYSHREMTPGNASYQIDPESHGPYDIGSVQTFGSWAPLAGPDYTWLGLDPADLPIAGPGGLSPARRWKALIRHGETVDGGEGLLSGSLPTGPLGGAISFGGGRGGGAVFMGELDEIRVTALPILLVSPDGGGWDEDDTSGAVERWYWDYRTDPAWPTLRHAKGAAFDMADVLGVPRMPASGLFIVQGRVYRYEEFDGSRFAGVKKALDNLYVWPTHPGWSPPPPGFWEHHEALRKIIPLSFVATTRLAADIDDPDAGSIYVADRTLLPPSGCVEVNGRVLPCESIRPWGAGDEGELVLRPPYGRGLAWYHLAELPAGTIVRHLPMRYVAGYSGRGGWDSHTAYTEPELDGRMSMYAFSVNHAGRLRSVRWHLMRPLLYGQKLVVLARIGSADAWNKDPDATDGDNLWGRVWAAPWMQDGILRPLNASGESPTVAPDQSVEVRFYFDLSERSYEPYDIRYMRDASGFEMWSEMGDPSLELDQVEIETLPEPTTF
jgi:hypothetical protein